jgi:hypothetical protein
MWFRVGVLVFQNRDKLPYLVAGLLFLFGFLFILPAMFLVMFFGGNHFVENERITPWLPLIEEKAVQHGLDPALVAAVVTQESGGDPMAVSPVGAMGLMQLMPETAKELGVEDPFDPEQNVEGGSKYLDDLLRQFEGNLVFAVAAYNAGPGAVRKYEGVPPYVETQTYVQKVMRYFFEYQQKFLSEKEGKQRGDDESSNIGTNVP